MTRYARYNSSPKGHARRRAYDTRHGRALRRIHFSEGHAAPFDADCRECLEAIRQRRV